jgi:hypothetical protein
MHHPPYIYNPLVTLMITLIRILLILSYLCSYSLFLFITFTIRYQHDSLRKKSNTRMMVRCKSPFMRFQYHVWFLKENKVHRIELCEVDLMIYENFVKWYVRNIDFVRMSDLKFSSCIYNGERSVKCMSKYIRKIWPS